MIDSGFKLRAFVVCVILVTGLSALSVRLIFLQVWDRKYTETSHIERFKIRKRLPAQRGLIRDRNKEVLVINKPEANLIADLNHLKTTDILWSAVARKEASKIPGWNELSEEVQAKRVAEAKRRLRKILSPESLRKAHEDLALEVIGRAIGVSQASLEEVIKNQKDKGQKRIVVKTRLDTVVADKLAEDLQLRHIQGFSFERSVRRFYTMPNLAPHVLGFLNYSPSKKKFVARNGIENELDGYLAGRDGEMILSQLENGQVNLTGPEKWQTPINGKHIQLTLDMGIQKIVEKELDRVCGELQPLNASIVVVEPHTGDILAMGSRPHFDLNDRSNFEFAHSSFAFSKQYESGSVMKIVSMGAALDSGKINRNSTIEFDQKTLASLGKPRERPFSGSKTFDWMLEQSNNPGVILFTHKYAGRATYYDYLEKFGFGSLTGIDLPGEVSGSIEDGSPNDFAVATYGYTVAVTPLQLAMAYSVLANGGLLLKPRIVDSVIANNGSLIKTFPIIQKDRVIRAETARQMCLSLEGVVLNGTGSKARISGYRVGGKTGTALKLHTERPGYDRDSMNRRFCTFAGIVPVHDPKFVCVVTIDEPTNLEAGVKATGGGTAAPVFQRVAKEIALQLNLTPTEEPLVGIGK
jgi:cell division protein FtsI/penicillin-binding protein 2